MTYKEHLASEQWKRLSRDTLERDGYECRICGGTATIAHHLTYEHCFHEEPDDLVSVCRSCHQDIHEWQRKTGRKDELPSRQMLYEVALLEYLGPARFLELCR